MRQAIETKYYGPTNHLGSRIRAKAQAGTRWVSYDYALGAQGSHVAAAKAFAEHYGWSGRWFGGATADGYAFVWCPGGPTFGGDATFDVVDKRP